MTVDKSDPIVDGRWIWRNGTTWHPRKWFGNEAVGPDPVQECFEVEWDADGKSRLTGRTAQMTNAECKRTQWATPHIEEQVETVSPDGAIA